MANELGPFLSAVKCVVLNPANAAEVWRLTTSEWVPLSSTPVFADCVVTAAQAGSTGLFYADLVGAPSTERVTVLVYSATASQFADPFDYGSFEPVDVPSEADIAGAVRTELATELAQLDAAVSSRATPADVTMAVTPSVIAAPVATSVTQPPLTTLGPDRPRNLSIYQNAAAVFPFNALDANGESIDLTGKTLRFVCCTTSGAVLFVRESGAGVSYADGTVSVSVTEAETASVADAVYRLWNVTDRQVLGAGRFEIRLAPINAPE